MNRADEVFALFVGANPVADVAAAEGRPRVEPVLPKLEGSFDMQSQEQVTQLGRTPRPPGRNKRLIPALAGAAAAILAVVVGVVVITGNDESGRDTAEPGPITSFEDIAGTTYELQNPDVGPSVFHFFEDGTWHVASFAEGVVDNPAGILETRFEGTRAFVTNVKGACTGPSEAIYEIYLLESGNLNLVLIEDPCNFRAAFFPGEWAPVP
jgi:hypothetical protein